MITLAVATWLMICELVEEQYLSFETENGWWWRTILNVMASRKESWYPKQIEQSDTAERNICGRSHDGTTCSLVGTQKPKCAH